MVLDPIPQPLPVHFFGSRPQPPTSLPTSCYQPSILTQLHTHVDVQWFKAALNHAFSRTYQCGMCNEWMSHVPHINESCPTHKHKSVPSAFAHILCVAVCCSVLQCVAVCCSVLQLIKSFLNKPTCVAVCCGVLLCVAVCCRVRQCVAANQS